MLQEMEELTESWKPYRSISELIVILKILFAEEFRHILHVGLGGGRQKLDKLFVYRNIVDDLEIAYYCKGTTCM